MKDDARHTQLNEAKWDRWAESFDGGGWVHRYLRDAQSKVVTLLDVKEDIHLLQLAHRSDPSEFSALISAGTTSSKLPTIP